MLVRGATTLDHQVKEILKNQSADPKFFSHRFFPCCIKIWNGLNPNLSLSSFVNLFIPNALFLYTLETSENRKILWCFQGVEEGCNGNKWVKIKSNSIFSVHNEYDIKFLSRLRLNFSINEHIVCHDFEDGTYCMCDCGSATETTLRFLLQSKYYQTVRLELLSSIYNLDSKIRISSSDKLLHLNYYTDQNDIVLK